MDPKQNPYVLGYGISQKIPHPVKGHSAFRPSKFFLSTTPCKNDSGQATLNFCMINANDHQLDDPLINPEETPSAGVFTPPLALKTRSVNLKSDGVFAASNALFFNHWLKPAILVPFDFGERVAKDSGCVLERTTTEGGNGLASASSYSTWAGDWIRTGKWYIAFHEHRLLGSWQPELTRDCC